MSVLGTTRAAVRFVSAAIINVDYTVYRMPQYKRARAVYLNQQRNPKAVSLLNRYASLRNQPVLTCLIALLQDILPGRIAGLRAGVKDNLAKSGENKGDGVTAKGPTPSKRAGGATG